MVCFALMQWSGARYTCIQSILSCMEMNVWTQRLGDVGHLRVNVLSAGFLSRYDRPPQSLDDCMFMGYTSNCKTQIFEGGGSQAEDDVEAVNLLAQMHIQGSSGATLQLPETLPDLFLVKWLRHLHMHSILISYQP